MEHLVSFLPSERSIRVPAGTPLIEATHRAGLPMASACSAVGTCARCGVEIVSGADALPRESAAETEAKARNRVADELRLACRVEVTSDLTIRAPYW